MARLWRLIMMCVALAALASCSTTRRLPEGEILYAGLKGVDARQADGKGLPAGVMAKLETAAAAEPNNAFFHSSSIRWPLPIGLWVYNNWHDTGHGLSHWLYEKLTTTPVLISDVRPEMRTRMMDQVLQQEGFFRGHAAYELVQGRNKRKARVLYTVKAGLPFPIDTVELLPDTTHLLALIDTLARRQSYLTNPDVRYCADSLAAVRTAITNGLRNRGYYYFRPEYIEYLADTLVRRGSAAMRMVLASNVPEQAMKRYTTGHVTVVLNRNRGGGTPDTIRYAPEAEMVVMRPARLRQKLIPENVVFRPGRTFSVRQMNTTQTRLSRLGIFNAIDISVAPDTAAKRPTLDVLVEATYDTPLEASVEVNTSYKSNSYLGPGLNFGVTNRNVFGGGEQLSLRLNGSYEWQTGHGTRSIFNSYEAGLTASLAFPRLLAPGFIPRRHRDLNWTRISLNADLLNRPHYFKIAQFNTALTYDWQVSRHVSNTFTPFKLTYTKLMHTTEEFDSIMQANPAVALSFMSQFIPQMAFGYIYDRQLDSDNNINWQFQIIEAGNIFWSIYELCGKHGEKKLFGTPFSQFVKGQTQLVWGHRLFGGYHWLYSRVLVGTAHAYGNSTQVPYADQFYIGGANSVRAFTVRSIGPGSYHDPKLGATDYFDQTGTFKFEANVEYRFPIYGPLHGAAFVDAGNVWLLRADPQRPGGLLQGKTFFKDLALGTGVGLRFDISMLVLRGDLGIGIHAPYDTGKRGYYNMTSFGHSLAFHLAIGYPF